MSTLMVYLLTMLQPVSLPSGPSVTLGPPQALTAPLPELLQLPKVWTTVGRGKSPKLSQSQVEAFLGQSLFSSFSWGSVRVHYPELGLWFEWTRPVEYRPFLLKLLTGDYGLEEQLTEI